MDETPSSSSQLKSPPPLPKTLERDRDQRDTGNDYENEEEIVKKQQPSKMPSTAKKEGGGRGGGTMLLLGRSSKKQKATPADFELPFQPDDPNKEG